jgi:hypothetical protein
MLSEKELRHQQAKAHGSSIGLYGYARQCHLYGYDDPHLAATHRAYRRCRMRLMLYARRLATHGIKAPALPAWRLPIYPKRPRRATAGIQSQLHFTNRLYEPGD